MTSRQMHNLAWRLKHVAQIAVVWLSANKVKPFTDAELVAFAKHVSYGFKPEVDLLVHELRFHHSARRLKPAEMAEIAKALAEGDEVVEQILLWNMQFQGGRIPGEPHLHKRVYFWHVGQNASHEFSAGTNGRGKRYRYSAGESADWDGVTGSPEIDVSTSEVENFSGHYGHF